MMKLFTVLAAQRRIQYGDIVKLDIGVVEDGWVGDTASTVAVGMIDERTETTAAGDGERAASGRSRWRIDGVRLGDICAEIEERSHAQPIHRLCASLSGTAWDENCTKSPRSRITASAAAVRG